MLRLLRPPTTRDPNRAGQRRLVAGFYARLGASIAICFALLSATGYQLIGEQLGSASTQGYTAEHASGAVTLSTMARRTHDGSGALEHVHELVAAYAAQTGVREMLVVDERGIVRAAGDPAAVGTRVRDRRVDAALRRSVSYTGRARTGEGLVELIAPLPMAIGRSGSTARPFAFVARRDARPLEDALAALRRTLVIVALLAMAGGSALFWLVSGRQLLRSHRIALQARRRATGSPTCPTSAPSSDELPRDGRRRPRATASRSRSIAARPRRLQVPQRPPRPPARRRAAATRVAGVLRGGRAGDRAYRIGGDEFALLLPRTDARRARGRRAAPDRARCSDAGVVGEHRASATLRRGAGGRRAAAPRPTPRCTTPSGAAAARVAHFDDDPRRGRDHDRRARSDAVRRLLDEGGVDARSSSRSGTCAAATLLGIEALDPTATRPTASTGPARGVRPRRADRARPRARRAVRRAARCTPPRELPARRAAVHQPLAADARPRREDDDWLLRRRRARRPRARDAS